jgi:hypothetical protein
MRGRVTAETQIKLNHAFDQVLFDGTPEARKVVVHLLGFAFCRGQEWPLLEIQLPSRTLETPDVQRQNAFLFYLFSYPVDYVLWINLSAAAKRQRRSPDGRGPLAAAKRQRIPCLSGANHPRWRGLQQPREESHACGHAGGWTTVQRNHQGVPPRYPL